MHFKKMQLRSCREPLDAQAVANAMHGLRRISWGDSEEYHQLVKALPPQKQEYGKYGLRALK